MRYFSMFSGIGGFEQGIEQAYNATTKVSITPKCVGYSEIDEGAIKVYEKHYEHKSFGDATRIDTGTIPDFDLLVGGFPCQAFSIAGKRRGFDDTRGTLFFEIARVLRDKRPRHFILENVKGLLSHEGGETYSTMLGVLYDLGYRVEWQILNSKNFRTPQNRERLYIIGHAYDCPRLVLPITKECDYHLEEITQKVSDAQRIYRISGIAKTLKALGGGLGAKTGLYQMTDNRVRKLLPVEAERLQGFYDGWTEGHSNEKRLSLCGNAVTVNTVQAVMEGLMKCL